MQILIVTDPQWSSGSLLVKQFINSKVRLIFTTRENCLNALKDNPNIRICAIDLFSGPKRINLLPSALLIREIRRQFKKKKVIVGMHNSAGRVPFGTLEKEVDGIYQKTELKTKIIERWGWLN